MCPVLNVHRFTLTCKQIRFKKPGDARHQNYCTQVSCLKISRVPFVELAQRPHSVHPLAAYTLLSSRKSATRYAGSRPPPCSIIDCTSDISKPSPNPSASCPSLLLLLPLLQPSPLFRRPHAEPSSTALPLSLSSSSSVHTGEGSQSAPPSPAPAPLPTDLRRFANSDMSLFALAAPVKMYIIDTAHAHRKRSSTLALSMQRTNNENVDTSPRPAGPGNTRI